MTWQDIAKKLAAIGLPLIGGAVGGPGGALVGKGIASALGLAEDATPEQAAVALGSMTGEQLVALRTLEAEQARVQMQTAAQQVDAVNKTLQTEAMGGSFWQKNHHAFESTLFLFFIIGVYFVLPLLKLPVPSIPEFAFVAVGSILGVTAWQRGAANVATAKS